MKLFNLELARGKFSKEVIVRCVPYAIAVSKKKQLISNGTIPRNIWIVAVK